ncbi:sodium:solute symporter family transporter, partial [Fusobacterium varium]|nr:solute:sodium symporter family transporter [Fusobacterium varium]
TIFSLNIYKPLFSPNISERNLIKVSKYFGTILAIFSMIVAPFISKSSGGLFEFIQKVAGLFSVPIAIIVLVGIFSKKTSALAAKVSMGFFVIVYGYTQFINPVKIHFLYVIAILFVICLFLMYIVDKIIPPKKEYFLPVRYEVSVEPWEYRYTVSVMLMSLLVWIYVVFSKIGLLSQSENLKGRIGIITFIFIVLTYIICIFTRKVEKKN